MAGGMTVVSCSVGGGWEKKSKVTSYFFVLTNTHLVLQILGNQGLRA